jgi:protein phosphatase PTC1
MIVRFNKAALLTTSKEPSSAIGVEGDPHSIPGKPSEVEKIVGDAKRKVQEDGIPGVGVSGSNSGKGHDPKMPDEIPIDESVKQRIEMEKVVEEEPGLVEGEDSEMSVQGIESISPDTKTKLKLPEGVGK